MSVSTPRKRRRSADTNTTTACESSDSTSRIRVNWELPHFNSLLANVSSERSQLFRHDALPGISWQLCVARCPDEYRLYLIADMGKNKCPATAEFAGFSLTLSSTDGKAEPLDCVLPLDVFNKERYFGLYRLEIDEVEKLCAEGGSLILSGEIVLELPSSGDSALRRMYESGSEFSDLAVAAADNHIFRVHKVVLAATCPTLLDLLQRDQPTVEIIASTPAAIMAMLQHLYGFRLNFSACLNAELSKLTDLAREVLLLSEHFKLVQLKQLCETALIAKLNSCNAVAFAQLATKANCNDLKNEAVAFAARNIDTLILTKDWIALKSDYPVTAMLLCESVIKELSNKSLANVPEQAAPPDHCQPCNSTLAPFEIPVRWEICDFQNQMENSVCGFGLRCAELFGHPSMPGVHWELVLYPNGKDDYSHHVALFMRPKLTSNKKSQATAPSGGFSLGFEVFNTNVSSPPPPQQTLPVQQFSIEQLRGIPKFAHQPRIDACCFTSGKTVVLTGKVLVAPPPNNQTRMLRQYYESGDRSDFTMMVDEESFPVHTFVLSASSPAMRPMFDNHYTESDNHVVTIKESSVEAVRALLQFWYGDPLCFDGLEELSMDVYKLANRYQDFELRQVCEVALIRMVKRDNVVHLAAFAVDQACEPLEKVTAKVIIENAVILTKDVWTQFKEENFALALTVAERIMTTHRKSPQNNHDGNNVL